MKKDRVITHCSVCKSSFEIKRCRINTAKYCSVKCYHIGRTITHTNKICKLCGKSFYARPSQFDRRIYCSKKCCYKSPERNGKISINMTRKYGSASHCWNGGRFISSKNTVYVYDKSTRNYIYESRKICEQFLNRKLDANEIVHHIDKNGTNNSPKNLFVFENSSEHSRFHRYLKFNTILKNWLKSNIL